MSDPTITKINHLVGEIERLRKALSDLVEEIVEGREHGDDAHDDECSLCRKIKAAQDVLAAGSVMRTSGQTKEMTDEQ